MRCGGGKQGYVFHHAWNQLKAFKYEMRLLHSIIGLYECPTAIRLTEDKLLNFKYRNMVFCDFFKFQNTSLAKIVESTFHNDIIWDFEINKKTKKKVKTPINVGRSNFSAVKLSY